MQRIGTLLLSDGLVAAPSLSTGLARGKLHLINHRIQVQPRTTAEDCRDASSQQAIDADPSVTLEEAHRIVLRDVGNVYHEELNAGRRR